MCRSARDPVSDSFCQVGGRPGKRASETRVPLSSNHPKRGHPCRIRACNLRRESSFGEVRKSDRDKGRSGVCWVRLWLGRRLACHCQDSRSRTDIPGAGIAKTLKLFGRGQTSRAQVQTRKLPVIKEIIQRGRKDIVRLLGVGSGRIIRKIARPHGILNLNLAASSRALGHPEIGGMRKIVAFF